LLQKPAGELRVSGSEFNGYKAMGFTEEGAVVRVQGAGKT